MSKTIVSSLAGTNRIRNLLATLFCLIAADGIISTYLVRQGLAQELNPFLKHLVAQDNFSLLKVAGALLSVFILWRLYKKRPYMSAVITLSTFIVYTGIVYWNLLVFGIAQA